MNQTIKILQPCGILDDITTNKLHQDIHNLVEYGVDIILVDFEKITLINSSGIGALVSTIKTAKIAGCQLAICSINAQVRMIFELTKIDRLLNIFANKNDFKNHFYF
ncbi:STAS domain-containing protein [Moorena sp. SIO3H5]|uniref:STAS domain-containing protein n=1 Tax=Moorena sp. SIO3H5 TaxID=2607834 RepID=UPI0013BE49AD|nr:STAS domain-containing protein [Moorena sp. SIO3H5]NEO69984.1 STAS domain-containing protein [Moorena sp. SIO3H5]